jgi:sugar phosphate isomerase/epimerase
VKLGLFTDSLGDLRLDEALDWAVQQGLEAVEIGTGNFSPAPHCDLMSLLQNETVRQEFLSALESRGLTLSALNCSGNLLDPHPQRRRAAQETFESTLELASLLGIDTVVTMSGCPGDMGEGSYPNWVTCTWQPEYVTLVERQWEQELVPFWHSAGEKARSSGVRIAIEMHPGQCVYNTRTLLRLRQIAGSDVLGANLDPSHLFFQNMDPITVVGALADGGIFHVHAKDTRINRGEMALNGSLDTRPMKKPGERSWEYVTLGFGHGESFWRGFVAALRIAGYDGVLSIEHEDQMMSGREGIRKSVEFLSPMLIRTWPDGEDPV